MICYEEAREIVQRRLDATATRLPVDFPRVVYDPLTREEDFGWVIFFMAKPAADLAKSGVALDGIPFEYHLAGAGPFIVDRRDGSIQQAGSAKPIEFYIEDYRNRRARGDA
jgi:hypothetical protein